MRSFVLHQVTQDNGPADEIQVILFVYRIHPQNILVPYRGLSARPREKAFFVGKLAEAFGAAVTVFHTPEPPTSFFRGVIQGAGTMKPLAGEMDRFLKHLEEFRLSPETRLGRGPAGRAITMEAAAQRNDLIIMGASERGLWESLVSGNPVEQVLRETPCNLIILLPRLKPA